MSKDNNIYSHNPSDFAIKLPIMGTIMPPERSERYAKTRPKRREYAIVSILGCAITKRTVETKTAIISPNFLNDLRIMPLKSISSKMAGIIVAVIKNITNDIKLFGRE